MGEFACMLTHGGAEEFIRALTGAAGGCVMLRCLKISRTLFALLLTPIRAKSAIGTSKWVASTGWFIGSALKKGDQITVEGFGRGYSGGQSTPGSHGK
jgi:hypothetical protein